MYGIASGPDDTNGANGHTKWAGYFPGYTYTPGGLWSSSDEQLKQNVTEIPLDTAVAKLMALVPKTYDFNQDQFGFMHLPTEHQYGLISQEVEGVLPSLVINIHQPAMLDSTGTEASPAIDFKAMSYQGFIPLLIAGFKAQQQQIAAMQQQLDACCAANQGMAPQGNASERRGEEGSDLREQRLLIIPNPVADLTTLEYYVPQAGKVSLSVSSSDGKPLGTLREEQDEAGAYSYPWNTTALAAGTYFCTYTLDGQVVVKRAVKVSR
ncbi:MAG: tail fiber domain-containing protein [Flavobacteriales bacterium]|nr:tail fiber domain-containing protein [Flavobacteriales bacterium]